MDIPLKQSLMSTVDMRNEVAGWLESLDDDFMAVVHAMVGTRVRQQQVETEPIVGYELDGTPVTASRFVEEAEAAVEAAKAGHSITVQELEKRSEEWLSRLQ